MPTVEADIFSLGALAWREKKIIAAITIAAAVLSAAYALLATEWYTAKVVLAPSSQQESLSLPSQLGGLVGLAGLDFGSSNSNEAKAILTSRSLTGQYVVDNDLLPILFASEWDEQSSSWATSDPDEQKDVRDAVDLFEDRIRVVSEESRTGLVTMRITWKDANLAAKWANDLVNGVNVETRQRAIDNARANIEYLQSELLGTTQVAVQQSISSVLESELQRLLIAQGNEEYAFTVIDPAEVPKYRSKPQRKLVVAAATLFALIFSCAFVVIREIVQVRRAAVSG